MSGGGTKQTQTNNSGYTNTTINGPYPKATGALDDLLKRATSLFKTNSLNPYVGMSGTANQALTGLKNTAYAGRSGLTDAFKRLQALGSGAADVRSAGQQTIANRALLPSYSEKNLGDVASGALLDRADPNFERLLARSTDNAATAARMSAGARGRYGGDFAQTEVARTVGDLEAQQRYQQYQNERDRQVQANQLMDEQRQAGLTTGLNALNSRTAIDASNRDRRMQAITSVPSMYQATLDPWKTIADVGTAYQTDTANRLGAPGKNLSSLAQLLQGLSGYGTNYQTGTQIDNNTSTTKQPTNWAQILGGGLGLADLLGF